MISLFWHPLLGSFLSRQPRENSSQPVQNLDFQKFSGTSRTHAPNGKHEFDCIFESKSCIWRKFRFVPNRWFLINLMNISSWFHVPAPLFGPLFVVTAAGKLFWTHPKPGFHKHNYQGRLAPMHEIQKTSSIGFLKQKITFGVIR